MDQLISVKREHFRNLLRKKELKAILNSKRTILQDQVYDHVPKILQIQNTQSPEQLLAIMDELNLISDCPMHIDGFVKNQDIIIRNFLETKQSRFQIIYLRIMLNILAKSDYAHLIYEQYQDSIFTRFQQMIYPDQNQLQVELILNILSNLIIDNNQPFIDYLYLEVENPIIYKIIQSIENMEDVKLKSGIRFLFNLVQLYQSQEFIDLDLLLNFMITICHSLNKLNELPDMELYMLLKSFKNILKLSIIDGYDQPYGFNKFEEVMSLYIMSIQYLVQEQESKFGSLFKGYITKAICMMLEHQLFRGLILDKRYISTLATLLLQLQIDDNSFQHKRAASILCSIVKIKITEYQVESLFLKSYCINQYDIKIITLLQRQVADEKEQDLAISSLMALLTLHDYGVQSNEFNEFFALCPHILKNQHISNDVKKLVFEFLFKGIIRDNNFKEIWHVYELFGIRDLCLPYIHSENTDISSTAMTLISVYDNYKEQVKKID